MLIIAKPNGYERALQHHDTATPLCTGLGTSGEPWAEQEVKILRSPFLSLLCLRSSTVRIASITSPG